VRRTLDEWREEYNGERPHSALACGNVDSKERFPHSHRHDYDDGCQLHSQPNQTRVTPVIAG